MEKVGPILNLKELSKNLQVMVMPTSLWAVHIDPQYNFIAILHIQFKLFASLDIDKGIVVTYNSDSKTIDVSLFVQNSVVEIPSVSNKISTISDLNNLIYYVHNLRLCPNARLQTEYPQCVKYIHFEQYDTFCQSCSYSSNETRNHATSEWVKDIATGESLNCIPNVGGIERSYVENICKICGKNFLTKLHLDVHLEEDCTQNSNESPIMHSKLNSYLCNTCGKTFRQHCKLKEHLLTHSPENQYQCDVCNKMFPKLYNLSLHQKTHTGSRPFVCSSCGKTYTSRSNLSTHVRSVHTNKKPYICSTCTMSFVHPRQLRIHMRKHTGEKPYKCLICEKTFAKNIHLTVHTRTHTGEKPHICTFCGKGFTTTGNLSSHIRVHHKDNDVMHNQ